VLLFGFNVGVEVGQVAVVLGSLPVARLCNRIGFAMPRPLFTDWAGAFLIGEGSCWFIGRSMVIT
jgi:hypothetical protein